MSRAVSPRWKAKVSGVTRWATVVEWSNDGGRSWSPCRFVSGGVTVASTSQIRWQMSITVAGVDIGRTGLHIGSRMRVRHGMIGEPLLGMGVYRVTSLSRSTTTPDRADIEASSFESYLINARLRTAKVYDKQPAGDMLAKMITEVLPDAMIRWRGSLDPGQVIPKIVVERDRWGAMMVIGTRPASPDQWVRGCGVMAMGSSTSPRFRRWRTQVPGRPTRAGTGYG